MAKRRLTADEIDKVREWALEWEREQYPAGTSVEIFVHAETDDNGKPRYAAIITREHVVPRGEVLF
jgi:hypothetical protein